MLKKISLFAVATLGLFFLFSFQCLAASSDLITKEKKDLVVKDGNNNIILAINLYSFPAVNAKTDSANLATVYPASFPFCKNESSSTKALKSEAQKIAKKQNNTLLKKLAVKKNIVKQVAVKTTKKFDVKKTTNQKELYVIATAYTSARSQTDSTPCTTANGFDVCKNNQENVIAANFLPFGTKVKLPEIYGDKIFTVQDRMHPRFNNRIDIWMKSLPNAKSFGKKKVKILLAEK
jgi:3D (Asp-Asp-Asp) domain-containing protein